eukprot:scaffold124637_cov60-Phaeocystis_antarctica.AAC.1
MFHEMCPNLQPTLRGRRALHSTATIGPTIGPQLAGLPQQPAHRQHGQRTAREAQPERRKCVKAYIDRRACSLQRRMCAARAFTTCAASCGDASTASSNRTSEAPLDLSKARPGHVSSRPCSGTLSAGLGFSLGPCLLV